MQYRQFFNFDLLVWSHSDSLDWARTLGVLHVWISVLKSFDLFFQIGCETPDKEIKK